MHNDRLQGILFDQAELLDLGHATHRSRFIRKVAIVRRDLAGWRISTWPMSRKVKKTKPVSRLYGQPVISKSLGKKQYEAAIDDLYARLIGR